MNRVNKIATRLAERAPSLLKCASASQEINGIPNQVRNDVFTQLRSVFLLGVLLFSASNIFAQTLTATVNKNPVKVGERFQYTVQLENGKGNIAMPNITDFRVVFGPSRSENVSIVNGSMSRSVSVSYLLIADAAGIFTIPKASATINGKKLETKALKIKAVGQASQQAGATQSKPVESKKFDQTGNLILRLEPSKYEAYVGEPIFMQYVLYSRYSNVQMGNFENTSFNGFWIEDIEHSTSNWEKQLEVINGMQYRKAILKKQVIFPQKDGKIKIDNASMACYINQSFFSKGTKMDVKSNSPTITVKKLPAPVPSNFSGLTGKLKVSAKFDKTEVNANESITLKITYSGEGSLNFIKNPEIIFPSDFEVYDPKIAKNLKIGYNGFKGSKTFEYLIIPRYSGEYTLPAYKVTYFNSSTGKYESTGMEATTLKISQGEGGAAAVQQTGSSKQDVQLLRQDIRYLNTNAPQAYSKSTFNPTHGIFWLFILLLVIGVFGGYFAINRQQSLQQNAVAFKAKKAGKNATKHLSKAKKEMASVNDAVFYQAIGEAIYGYLSQKMGIPIADLNRNLVKEKLSASDKSLPLLTEVEKVLDVSQMAQYAASSIQTSKEDLYQQTVQLITKLEKVL